MERFVSKKKLTESRRIAFVFDFDVTEDEAFKETGKTDKELDLTRWFTKQSQDATRNKYDFIIDWGDYVSKERITGNATDGFERSVFENGTWSSPVHSARLNHIYHIGDIDTKVELTQQLYEKVKDFLPRDYFLCVGEVAEVSLTGSIPSLDGGLQTHNDTITQSLISCHIPIGYESPLEHARAIFKDCTRFASVDGRIFKHCTEARDMRAMFMNTSLRIVPAFLLYKCSNVENLSAFFKSSQIQKLPNSLLKNCEVLSDVSEFVAGVASLTEVPEDLFLNCSKIEYADSTFYFMPRCTNIPATIFREDIHTALEHVNNIFSAGTVGDKTTWLRYDNEYGVIRKEYHGGVPQPFTSELPELWCFASVLYYEHAYRGCDNAANAEFIPETWK